MQASLLHIIKAPQHREAINSVQRYIRTGFAIAALLAGSLAMSLPSKANAEVTVKRVVYNGWKDAVQMSNGTVEVVIVPQIGRIMRYGYTDGPNVLWNNPDLAGKTTDLTSANKDWLNYGGDKLWPAPQERWGWPPDRVLDSGLQTVKTLPNRHVVLTGQTGEKISVQFRREIALDATGTGVTLTNTLVNMGTKDVDWGVWEVAQIDNPTEARLLLNKSGHFPTGYNVFGEDPLPPEIFQQTDTQLILKRSPTRSAKVGSDAPGGQLEAISNGIKFTFSARYESGAAYPDKGCAQEIYTNPDPSKYVELELLGPMKPLKPQAARQFVTHWSLSK